MLRTIKTGLTLAILVTSAIARAEYTGAAYIESEPVNIDSVLSIGATTTMNEHDAIVSAPSKGKIVASANADVFCSGDETARSLVINVEEASNVMLDFCEAHLERRDVVIRFVAEN